MLIVLLFLLTVNLATADQTNSYLMGNSFNRRGIFFSQMSLDWIESIFENVPTTPLEVRHKILQNFISYGVQQGFNSKTVLGRFKFNNPNTKAFPSLEKITNPLDISKNIFKIKLDPEKFKMKPDEKLTFSIQLESETSKEPKISMTPAMKMLIKKMSANHLAVQ